MKTITIPNINWPELANQKQTLLKLKEEAKGKTKEDLQGILNVITKLQDAAEKAEVPQHEIFPPLFHKVNALLRTS